MIQVHTIQTKKVNNRYYAEAHLSDYKFCDKNAIKGIIELHYLCDSRREAYERLVTQLKDSKIQLDNNMHVYDV